MCEDVKRERGVCQRALAAANAWRAVEGVMANRRISKRLKDKVMIEQLCDTGMPIRNGNLGNCRTATTKAASVRKQLGTKNSKSRERKQKKNIEKETGVQKSLN